MRIIDWSSDVCSSDLTTLEWYVVVPICLVTGALIGYVGGILGIGGGLLAIPLLGLAAGMDQQEAQGTALVMVLPAVLVTVRKYNQNAKIDIGAAAAGALAAIVFTWLGARLALGIDPVLMRRIYAVFIMFLAVFYMYQSLRGSRVGSSSPARRSTQEFHKGWFRSEEHTSELQSLMRTSYAVFCLKKQIEKTA